MPYSTPSKKLASCAWYSLANRHPRWPARFMNRTSNLARVLGCLVATAVNLCAAPTARPDIESTYTITATLQLARPFNPADMQDDFQDVRVVEQNAESCTVEITYYPLHRPAIGENPRWRAEYAG